MGLHRFSETILLLGLAMAVATAPGAVHGQSFTLTEINPDSSTLDATNPNGATGGRVNGVGTTSDGDTLYAASEWGGMYKSTDAGLTWSYLPDHVPQATWDVEVAPDDGMLVFATSFYDGRVDSRAGVNISVDGGQTWTHPAGLVPEDGFCLTVARQEEPSGFGIAIDPDEPDHVYVGTNCGLLVSTDRGATWDRIDPTPADGADNVWDVIVHDGGVIDLCGDDGHLRSTDGGGTWTTATGAGLPAGRCALAVSPDEDYVLFAVVGTQPFESDDAGASWQSPLNNPTFPGQGRIPFVQVNDRGGRSFDLWFGDIQLNRVGCTTPSSPSTGGTARCTGTWSADFSTPAGAHNDLGPMIFDPEADTNACPLLVATDGGVYYNTTTSSPACHTPTWEQPDRTPHGLWVWDVSGGPTSGTSGNLFFGNQDNGNFSTQNAGAASPTWINRDCCDGFEIEAEATRTLVSQCCWNSGRFHRLFLRNANLGGGAQINNYPPGTLPPFQAPDILARFGTASYAIVTTAGAFTTTNVAATPSITWNRLGTQASTPAGACGIRAGRDGGTPVFYLRSGGCRIQNPDQLFRLDGVGSGSAWQPVNPPGGLGGFGVFDIDPDDPDRILASHLRPGQDPQMILSTDGGQTWTNLTGLDTLMQGATAFRYANRTGQSQNANGAVHGFNGYVQPSLVALSRRDDLMIAGGIDSGVFVSTDGGSDWTLVTDPDDPARSGVPHIPRPQYAHFAPAGFSLFQQRDVVYIGTVGRGVWRLEIIEEERDDIIDLCTRLTDDCRIPDFAVGEIIIRCDRFPCVRRDPVPRNCQLKFDCPGCGPGMLCPPYHHMYIDGLDPETWRLALYTGQGDLFEHRVLPTETGVVLSFRPDERRWREGRIGDYQILFALQEGAEPGSYRFGTRLEVSDSPEPRGVAGPPPAEDCLPIRSSRVRMEDRGALGWLVTDGVSQIAMADDRADAKEVVKLASRHTHQCFIGRDNTRSDRLDYIVQYWKGDSGLAVAVPGEADCVPYASSRLRIDELGTDGFLLTDGTSRMLRLDDRADARAALRLARDHDRHCFIGRDNQRPDRQRYIIEFWRP